MKELSSLSKGCLMDHQAIYLGSHRAPAEWKALARLFVSAPHGGTKSLLSAAPV